MDNILKKDEIKKIIASLRNEKKHLLANQFLKIMSKWENPPEERTEHPKYDKINEQIRKDLEGFKKDKKKPYKQEVDMGEYETEPREFGRVGEEVKKIFNLSLENAKKIADKMKTEGSTKLAEQFLKLFNK